MNILFTGHRGFLGRELIPYLAKNHNVFYPDIDYTNKELVDLFVEQNNIEYILHAAIKGGRRVRQDIPDDFYINIKMFENLAIQKIPMINFCSGAAYGRQEDIYLMEEYKVGERIPEDYYGFAKNLITNRCRQLDHVYNLRFFNVFGPQTPDNMFTSVNIKNYMFKKEIVIFKDKFMDFFGIEDTKKVVDLYLELKQNLPKEVNLVYDVKTKLSDVADIINNLSDYKVPINFLEEGIDKSYCGSGLVLKQFELKFDGLENELTNCYEYFCQRNI
jgi:nucleoside-diphosphate-sugar epimerase